MIGCRQYRNSSFLSLSMITQLPLEIWSTLFNYIDAYDLFCLYTSARTVQSICLSFNKRLQTSRARFCCPNFDFILRFPSLSHIKLYCGIHLFSQQKLKFLPDNLKVLEIGIHPRLLCTNSPPSLPSSLTILKLDHIAVGITNTFSWLPNSLTHFEAKSIDFQDFPANADYSNLPPGLLHLRIFKGGEWPAEVSNILPYVNPEIETLVLPFDIFPIPKDIVFPKLKMMGFILLKEISNWDFAPNLTELVVSMLSRSKISLFPPKLLYLQIVSSANSEFNVENDIGTLPQTLQSLKIPFWLGHFNALPSSLTAYCNDSLSSKPEKIPSNINYLGISDKLYIPDPAAFGQKLKSFEFPRYDTSFLDKIDSQGFVYNWMYEKITVCGRYTNAGIIGAMESTFSINFHSATKDLGYLMDNSLSLNNTPCNISLLNCGITPPLWTAVSIVTASVSLDFSVTLRIVRMMRSEILQAITLHNIIASQLTEPGVIVELLAQKELLDSLDELSNTPLQTAAKFKKISIAETLIKLGANQSHKNKFGETFLDILKSKSFTLAEDGEHIISLPSEAHNASSSSRNARLAKFTDRFAQKK